MCAMKLNKTWRRVSEWVVRYEIAILNTWDPSRPSMVSAKKELVRQSVKVRNKPLQWERLARNCTQADFDLPRCVWNKEDVGDN